MKIKWVAFRTNYSFNDLVQSFLYNQYSQANERGFVLTRANDKLILGKHVVKTLQKESVEDPFGGHFEREYTVFETVEFELSAERPNSLKLKNPPRKLKLFLQDFLHICGFRSMVSEIKVDCLGVVSFLESKGLKCQVTQMDLEGVPISDDSTASLTLKGVGDVRSSIQNILPGKSVKAKKLSVLIGIDGERCSSVIASTGLFLLNPRGEFPLSSLEVLLYESLLGKFLVSN
ncbi:hypothetical protein [Marinobacter salarius]|uniref:hypothetical protein n=1 Tax=Marinobacter salarius TaxID=1420917 RepID=UPI001BCBEAD4|nr:hypothetical protein [Marinobacter salarius]MBS8233292.1 hypothetical protein [Marinobacter salarius]